MQRCARLTQGWIGVRPVQWHLIKGMDYQLARQAKEAGQGCQRKYSQPATEPHCIGHAEQAKTHEDVNLRVPKQCLEVICSSIGQS